MELFSVSVLSPHNQSYIIYKQNYVKEPSLFLNDYFLVVNTLLPIVFGIQGHCWIF